MTKKCSKCKEIKDTSEFYTQRYNGKVRLASRCKVCSIPTRKRIADRYSASNIGGKTAKEKRCNDCKETKLASLFSKKRNSKDGLCHICRECRSKQRSTPEARKKINKYETYKRRTDILFNITSNLRRRLRKMLHSRNASHTKYLGCSIKQLKTHLESNFYPNPETGESMTWNNYGYYGWHIDHIIPLSKFNLLDEEIIKVACHYSNLQPMWREDNQSKGNRITPPQSN